MNNGREEIVTSVSGALVGVRTCHHGHMPEIEITGDGTARGIWAMSDYVEWDVQPTAHAWPSGLRPLPRGVQAEDGEWRIARTRLERLRIDWLGAALDLPE